MCICVFFILFGVCVYLCVFMCTLSKGLRYKLNWCHFLVLFVLYNF